MRTTKTAGMLMRNANPTAALSPRIDAVAEDDLTALWQALDIAEPILGNRYAQPKSSARGRNQATPPRHVRQRQYLAVAVLAGLLAGSATIAVRYERGGTAVRPLGPSVSSSPVTTPDSSSSQHVAAGLKAACEYSVGITLTQMEQGYHFQVRANRTPEQARQYAYALLQGTIPAKTLTRDQAQKVWQYWLDNETTLTSPNTSAKVDTSSIC